MADNPELAEFSSEELYKLFNQFKDFKRNMSYINSANFALFLRGDLDEVCYKGYIYKRITPIENDLFE